MDSVIRYLRRTYPDKEINISAHSAGTTIVALLSPEHIRKIVFTSVPGLDSGFIITELQKRIIEKGGVVDETDITRYPRSSGRLQLIGRDFWRTLRSFDAVRYLEELGEKTDLIIYKPVNDGIIPYKHFDGYKTLKNVEYVEVAGDHNFKKPADRRRLMQMISDFLE